MRLEFDHEPNNTDALRWLVEGVADLYPWLAVLLQKMEDILSDQDTINAYVARINAAVAAIGEEIATLKAQPAAAELDFSGLDGAVKSTEALEAPVVAPAPEAPAPVEAPADPAPVADAPAVNPDNEGAVVAPAAPAPELP